MSSKGKPARKAIAIPSPVTVCEYVVNPYSVPPPPVAISSALPRSTTVSPLAAWIPTRPANRPPSTRMSVTKNSSYRVKHL